MSSGGLEVSFSIYSEIFEKMMSGGLEVMFSIEYQCYGVFAVRPPSSIFKDL